MQLIQPKGDDGIIQRAKMPQIDDADIPTLLAYLGSFKVGLSAGMIEPRKVKSHQDIDVDRANKIPAKWLKTPVLISKDHYVIDGNHRWYRHTVDGTMMPFIKFYADFKTCLHYIFSFPQTYEEK